MLDPAGQVEDGFRFGLNGNRMNGRSSFGERGGSSDGLETTDAGARLGGSCEMVGQVSRLDRVPGMVHERLEEAEGCLRNKSFVSELEEGKARMTEIEELDNQNESTNPNITINIVDSKAVEIGDRISISPNRMESSHEINGLNRTAYSTIEESSEEDKSVTRNRAGSLIDNSVPTESNIKTSKDDCSICKNSYIISHISNISSQVFSDNSHICGDNFSNTSSNIPNYNVCDVSEKKSNGSCSTSSHLSNAYTNMCSNKPATHSNGSPKNMPTNISRNNLSKTTMSNSSISNNSPTNRPIYVSNKSINLSNTSNKSCSFNNDADSVSSNVSNSPNNSRSSHISNKTSNISSSINPSNNGTFSNISSNTLSVNNLKRFNKCKSIDTSFDEIEYDLVGVSFLNPAGTSSRSNSNISTICNVSGTTTSTTNGRRKFSIGTNNAALSGNEETPMADLSKPYNLYRCLNQGNRYLKRQYSIDKPGVSVGEATGSKENGNKSVVKIQIHRE